jgi:hypothetical protein
MIHVRTIYLRYKEYTSWFFASLPLMKYGMTCGRLGRLLRGWEALLQFRGLHSRQSWRVSTLRVFSPSYTENGRHGRLAGVRQTHFSNVDSGHLVARPFILESYWMACMTRTGLLLFLLHPTGFTIWQRWLYPCEWCICVPLSTATPSSYVILNIDATRCTRCLS